jgi:glutamate racemase
MSSYEQQKIYGDYKNQIQDAFQGINLFNGGIGGFVACKKLVVLVTYYHIIQRNDKRYIWYGESFTSLLA